MERFGIPTSVTSYLRERGYPVPYTAMKPYIDTWYSWLNTDNDFYDYTQVDPQNRRHRFRRLSCRPARGVCREWASLIFDDKSTVSTDDEACTEYLNGFLTDTGFWSRGQDLVEDAFGLGTGAWAVWVDTQWQRLSVWSYDARMVIPLSWSDEVTECAFVTMVNVHGSYYYQLQMHVNEGTYHIRTAMFDEDGNQVMLPDGVVDDLDTRSERKTFAIVRPAIKNHVVDMSPYGESIFHDGIDAIKAVDVAFDAMTSEVKLGKMRVFMSDMLFDTSEKGMVPFGTEDDVVLRKVMSNDDMIETFAPALRVAEQERAYERAWQTLGERCGFGQEYFSPDKTGGLRTATEVSSDNAELMRNIRKHENLLGKAVSDICHAVLHCSRQFLGVPLPDEGIVRFNPDDSIIADTAAQKAQDMAEVAAGIMAPWEYRVKWYDEDEETAMANVPTEFA